MKANPEAVGRIAIEECIRCIALEAIIGTPPIGIVEGLGFSDRTVEVVGAISLASPLLVAVFMFVRRVRRLQSGEEEKPRKWRERSRLGVLFIAAAFAIAYGVWLHATGLTSKSEMALGIAVTLGWGALGLALTLWRR